MLVRSFGSSDLRDMNRKSVFDYIASNDEVSRPMIVQATGISGPTVLRIVGFLVEEGLALELGERGGTVGRKPQMLSFNKDRYCAIGVVLEGAYLRAAIVNLSGQTLCATSIEVRGQLGEIMTSVVPRLVEKVIRKSGIPKERLLGIGLGLPCSYDCERHMANFAPLIGVNQSVCTLEWERALSEKTGLPLLVDNDVNMAVFGEYRARRLQGSDLAYISIGTGLGAGIMLDGKLRHGTSAQCGEIGYMTFESNYVASLNNPGWLEQSINLATLRERFGFSLTQESPKAREQVAEYISSYVALCITNFVSIIDCGMVCLGGILPRNLGDSLFSRVRERLNTICAISINLQKPILEDAGTVGASMRIIEQELARILGK